MWRSDNGCSGELLASTGYVVLWGNALQDLAETLDYGDRPGQATFATVASALTWRDMSPPEPVDTKTPAPTPTSKPGPAPAAQRRSVAAAPDLSKTWPGRRNISLFDEVRLWAYRAYRNFSQYEDFAEAARQRALAGRERMPALDDFEDAEAATVATSVSVWTWTKKPSPQKRKGNEDNSGQQKYSPRAPATGEQQYRGDPALNADSEIQRYRRGCRTRLDAIRVEHRQACVANRHVLGTPVAKLAATFGVTRRTVERDLSTAQLPTRRRARRTLQAQDNGRRRRKRQADQAISGTGTITGRETTAGHSSPAQGRRDREERENQPTSTGTITARDTTARHSAATQENRDTEDQGNGHTPAPNLTQEGRTKAPPLINGLLSHNPPVHGPDPPDGSDESRDGPGTGPANALDH